MVEKIDNMLIIESLYIVAIMVVIAIIVVLIKNKKNGKV